MDVPGKSYFYAMSTHLIPDISAIAVMPSVLVL